MKFFESETLFVWLRLQKLASFDLIANILSDFEAFCCSSKHENSCDRLQSAHQSAALALVELSLPAPLLEGIDNVHHQLSVGDLRQNPNRALKNRKDGNFSFCIKKCSFLLHYNFQKRLFCQLVSASGNLPLLDESESLKEHILWVCFFLKLCFTREHFCPHNKRVCEDTL